MTCSQASDIPTGQVLSALLVLLAVVFSQKANWKIGWLINSSPLPRIWAYNAILVFHTIIYIEEKKKQIKKKDNNNNNNL